MFLICLFSHVLREKTIVTSRLLDLFEKPTRPTFLFEPASEVITSKIPPDPVGDTGSPVNHCLYHYNQILSYGYNML